jgi:hypothetical protein
MENSDSLDAQVQEWLGSNVEHYDVPAIVQSIQDRFGDVETLEYVDADTLHAIVSANEV